MDGLACAPAIAPHTPQMFEGGRGFLTDAILALDMLRLTLITHLLARVVAGNIQDAKRRLFDPGHSTTPISIMNVLGVRTLTP